MAQTAVFRGTGLLMSAACTFVSVRLVIAHLGPSLYAGVTLIATLVALFPFTDLGTGAAVTTAVAGSSESMRQTITASLRTSVLAGVVIAALAVIGTIANIWQGILGLDQVPPNQVNAAVCLVAGLFATLSPLAIGQRILLGLHRAPLVAIVTSAQALVALIVTVALIQLGAPAWSFVGPMLIAQVLGGALLLLLAYKNLAPIQRPGFRAIFFERLKPTSSVRRTAVPALVVSMSLILALQTDRLVLSHYGTPTDLAEYSLGAQVYATALLFLGSVGASLWPIFRREVGEGRITQSRRLLRKYMVTFFVIGLVVAGAYVVAMPAIARVLAGGEISQPYPLRLAFGALFLIQATQYPAGMYLTGDQGFRFQAVTTSVMLPLNLALSILFAASVGAPGPLIGSAISILVCQLAPCSIAALKGRFIY